MANRKSTNKGAVSAIKTAVAKAAETAAKHVADGDAGWITFADAVKAFSGHKIAVRMPALDEDGAPKRATKTNAQGVEVDAGGYETQALPLGEDLLLSAKVDADGGVTIVTLDGKRYSTAE